MSELPRQSPKLCVYKAGLRSSERYIVAPELSVAWTYCVFSEHVRSTSEKIETRRNKAADQDLRPAGERGAISVLLIA